MALVSPASTPKSRIFLDAGKRSLEALGFRVHVGEHALSSHGYLAGTDEERARDFSRAWLDPEIKAIFCTRGGYGTARLLEQFDLDQAVQHPKIMVGFSDLTTLHLALQSRGLVSFWGPMAGVYPGLNAFSAKCLKQALMTLKPIGLLPVQKNAGKTLHPGKAEGRLTGGTLTLMAASLGTPYSINTCGRIVFMEDTGEEAYKVDRLLTQLLAAGKLVDAAGIAIGRFTETESGNYPRAHNFSLQEVLADRLRPLHIPVFSGLDIGHIRNQPALPYGIRTRLDAGLRTLEILDTAVR